MTSVSSNQIKSNQIKSNQIKSNQIKSNQIKSNQIKSNQIKSNQIKSNQIKSFICIMQDKYRHIIHALVWPNILPLKEACKFRCFNLTIKP